MSLRTARLAAILALLLSPVVVREAPASPPPWTEDHALAILRVGAVRDMDRKPLDFKLGAGAASLFRVNRFLRAGLDAGYLDLPDRVVIRDSVSWDSTGITVTIFGIDREKNQSFYGAAAVHLVMPGRRLAPYALATFGIYGVKLREIEESRSGISLGIGVQPAGERTLGAEVRFHRIGLRPDGLSLLSIMFGFKFP